ncbi:hypothetical protein AUJ17_04755 [Candidatus Micrarchaeota archaeon CG1_02_47_40]|nr:MAG: hypothetical protein AUJ17_04755 [Candidatus Micrarchaeota archaeon CG1_02_47_40]
MTLPKNRSRSVRKIYGRTPQGKSRIRYKRREKGKAHACAVSAVRLFGTTSQKKTSKTQKVPNRMFGGHLSAKITERIVRLRSRLAGGEISISDIPINIRKYLGVKS